MKLPKETMIDILYGEEILPTTEEMVYCPDKECPAHDCGLQATVDPEGITYLSETI